MKSFQVTLTPSESKRLIARGVVRLPVVQQALKGGIVVVALGSTCAFVAEELLGREIDKSRYVVGIVDGYTRVTPEERRLAMVALHRGVEVDAGEVEKKLGGGDVLIKGANALAGGEAGVFLAHPRGGTSGRMLGLVLARGVNLVVPVGLEKTIPGTISDICRRVGIQRCERSTGLPVGMMPLPGEIVTEVEALKLLGAREAFPIGAGGIGGGEGSVTLWVEGPDSLFSLLEEIKGEKPLVSQAEKS